MATTLRRNGRVLGRGRAARRRHDAAGVRVGALFDEYAPMVLAVCRYQLRDPQAAEDAAQETFLSAHRSLLGGTRPRDPAAWLATIARNECRRTRRTARPAPLHEEETPGTVRDPADIVADRADLSEVAEAIAELPDRQREALVLREFCGLSYEQTAAAMSVSGAAVDSLLSRARRRLVEQLGEIPRAAHGTLVVPAALREELARLIPGLDGAVAGAGVGAGVGGAATLAGLGSAPVAAKVAATCAAVVAVGLPVQATVRGDENRATQERPRFAAAQERGDRSLSAAQPIARELPAAPPPVQVSEDDSSGPGSGGSGSSGSDSSGSGSSGSDSSGSGSSGSGSSGSDSSGSGSSGSGSSGSGSSGSDSSGSGSSGSGSSGSGSSGSGSSGSGSSGSGSSGSGSSGSGSSGSGSSGSGSSGSGSSGSDSSGSGSSGSGSGSSGSGSSGSG